MGDDSSVNGRPTMMEGFDARWLFATMVRKSLISFERLDICVSICCLIWSRATDEKWNRKRVKGLIS